DQFSVLHFQNSVLGIDEFVGFAADKIQIEGSDNFKYVDALAPNGTFAFLPSAGADTTRFDELEAAAKKYGGNVDGLTLTRAGLMTFNVTTKTTAKGKTETLGLKLVLDSQGSQVHQWMELGADQYRETAYFQNNYSLTTFSEGEKVKTGGSVKEGTDTYDYKTHPTRDELRDSNGLFVTGYNYAEKLPLSMHITGTQDYLNAGTVLVRQGFELYLSKDGTWKSLDGSAPPFVFTILKNGTAKEAMIMADTYKIRGFALIYDSVDAKEPSRYEITQIGKVGGGPRAQLKLIPKTYTLEEFKTAINSGDLSGYLSKDGGLTITFSQAVTNWLGNPTGELAQVGLIRFTAAGQLKHASFNKPGEWSDRTSFSQGFNSNGQVIRRTYERIAGFDGQAFQITVGKNGLIGERIEFMNMSMASLTADLWREDTGFRWLLIGGAIGAFVVAAVGAFFTGGGTLVGYFSALATIGMAVLGVGLVTAGVGYVTKNDYLKFAGAYTSIVGLAIAGVGGGMTAFSASVGLFGGVAASTAWTGFAWGLGTLTAIGNFSLSISLGLSLMGVETPIALRVLGYGAYIGLIGGFLRNIGRWAVGLGKKSSEIASQGALASIKGVATTGLISPIRALWVTGSKGDKILAVMRGTQMLATGGFVVGIVWTIASPQSDMAKTLTGIAALVAFGPFFLGKIFLPSVAGGGLRALYAIGSITSGAGAALFLTGLFTENQSYMFWGTMLVLAGFGIRAAVGVSLVKNAAAAKVMTSDIALQVGGKLATQGTFKVIDVIRGGGKKTGKLLTLDAVKIYESAASSILMFKIFPVSQSIFGIDHLFAYVLGPAISRFGQYLLAVVGGEKSGNPITTLLISLLGETGLKNLGERLSKVDLQSMVQRHSDGKKAEGWLDLVADRIHSEFGFDGAAWSGSRMLHDALLGQVMHVFGITYSSGLAGSMSKTQGFFSGIARSLGGLLRKVKVFSSLSRGAAQNLGKSLPRRFGEKVFHQVDNLIMFNLIMAPIQATAGQLSPQEGGHSAMDEQYYLDQIMTLPSMVGNFLMMPLHLVKAASTGTRASWGEFMNEVNSYAIFLVPQANSFENAGYHIAEVQTRMSREGSRVDAKGNPKYSKETINYALEVADALTRYARSETREFKDASSIALEVMLGQSLGGSKNKLLESAGKSIFDALKSNSKLTESLNFETAVQQISAGIFGGKAEAVGLTPEAVKRVEAFKTEALQILKAGNLDASKLNDASLKIEAALKEVGERRSEVRDELLQIKTRIDAETKKILQLESAAAARSEVVESAKATALPAEAGKGGMKLAALKGNKEGGFGITDMVLSMAAIFAAISTGLFLAGPGGAILGGTVAVLLLSAPFAVSKYQERNIYLNGVKIGRVNKASDLVKIEKQFNESPEMKEFSVLNEKSEKSEQESARQSELREQLTETLGELYAQAVRVTKKLTDQQLIGLIRNVKVRAEALEGKDVRRAENKHSESIVGTLLWQRRNPSSQETAPREKAAETRGVEKVAEVTQPARKEVLSLKEVFEAAFFDLNSQLELISNALGGRNAEVGIERDVMDFARPVKDQARQAAENYKTELKKQIKETGDKDGKLRIELSRVEETIREFEAQFDLLIPLVADFFRAGINAPGVLEGKALLSTPVEQMQTKPIAEVPASRAPPESKVTTKKSAEETTARLVEVIKPESELTAPKLIETIETTLSEAGKPEVAVEAPKSIESVAGLPKSAEEAGPAKQVESVVETTKPAQIEVTELVPA
ncbi:MAG TPA: hypothetical protein DIS66_02770, partial [Candidatus Omnitrophica bacterium]|nr:hypothetical protein [Candidatus Omnitrophota bacterium]